MHHTSGRRYSFTVLCMVMFRLKWENLTSINFFGFRDLCQYLCFGSNGHINKGCINAAITVMKFQIILCRTSVFIQSQMRGASLGRIQEFVSGGLNLEVVKAWASGGSLKSGTSDDAIFRRVLRVYALHNASMNQGKNGEFGRTHQTTPPPPPPPQYPPQHEASHYSYIIIILLSMSELRPSCEPLNSDTVNSKLWSSLSEVFHTRALPATSNRLWQNNTCSVHSLKDSFQVHSSGYFPDQHWSNSFSSQLLVHTQEVDFNHQADTGGKGNTVRSHKPYRLIFQTPLFRGSFCRADQHKKDRCSESTARERSRPDACILELLL